jgi:hypothetical protein
MARFPSIGLSSAKAKPMDVPAPRSRPPPSIPSNSSESEDPEASSPDDILIESEGENSDRTDELAGLQDLDASGIVSMMALEVTRQHYVNLVRSI